MEDKLSDYLPEFKEMNVQTDTGIQKAKKPILIKHLFEMTAGFSYNLASEQLLLCQKETADRCPTRETMKYLAKEPLLFEPGERWEYSLCHDVLAALVEVTSGEKFEDYIEKHIFNVLNMKDSTFMLPEEEETSIAQLYRFEDGKAINVGKKISYKLGTEYASGGAGGISTVDDYIKFLEGLRTGVLLKPDTLKFMITDRISEKQKSTYWSRDTHGYGLSVRCPSDNKRYQDFGWGGAAGTYLAIDMEHEISIYFVSHLLSSPVQGMRSMLYRFIKGELIDNKEFLLIQKELKELHNYHLTY